jgi:hypothetical protein
MDYRCCNNMEDGVMWDEEESIIKCYKCGTRFTPHNAEAMRAKRIMELEEENNKLKSQLQKENLQMINQF